MGRWYSKNATPGRWFLQFAKPDRFYFYTTADAEAFRGRWIDR
jgi:hypothetical protein